MNAGVKVEALVDDGVRVAGGSRGKKRVSSRTSSPSRVVTASSLPSPRPSSLRSDGSRGSFEASHVINLSWRRARTSQRVCRTLNGGSLHARLPRGAHERHVRRQGRVQGELYDGEQAAIVEPNLFSELARCSARAACPNASSRNKKYGFAAAASSLQALRLRHDDDSRTARQDVPLLPARS